MFLFGNKSKDNPYIETMIESLKCHHIDISKYIKNNYLTESKSHQIQKESIESYNFQFITTNQIENTDFIYFCANDYFEIVQLLLSQQNIDINCQTIQIQYFILFKYNISLYSNTIFHDIQIQY